ncbi:hypothetical protein LCGC14_0196130 [marine sediment metagenome]|uniref:Transmembrane protein n=1 Tax=marine sediment metagenome TaxID=412755 RepID=A0A0F9UKM8_9ZZZZ
MQISLNKTEKIVLLYLLAIPLAILTILFWTQNWRDYKWVAIAGNPDDPMNNDLNLPYVTILIFAYYILLFYSVGSAQINRARGTPLHRAPFGTKPPKHNEDFDGMWDAFAWSFLVVIMLTIQIIALIIIMLTFVISPWRANNQMAMEKTIALENRMDELSDKFFTRLETLEEN